MLTFDYVAHNPSTGEKVKAQVEAEDENAAASLIRKQGLTPIDIKSIASTSGFGKYFNKVKTKDKILFSRQLATLLGAGLPLVQALRSTADQTASKPLKVVINSLVSNIEAGSSLSAAMAKNPQVFNAIYINLVAAGEASGTLDKSLERLASQQEKDADIVSKVRGAFAYPIIVLVLMLGVIGFMIIKVLPAVGSLYSSLPGVHLPLITQVLLSVSHFGINYWWVVILAIIAIAFFGNKWAKTATGKSVVDKLKMVMWPIGPLFMKVYMARFARTGSTLISSGVPILQVLEITSGSINNVHISASLSKAIEKVKGGTALSDAISKDPNFLPLVPNMLKIGEQSGTIEQMMERVAEYYEREVDNEIKAISTIMEPVLMILLGVMAFIVVAAVLLPIYSLAGNSSLTSAF
jgi:type IV pilus assembly protein PilC